MSMSDSESPPISATSSGSARDGTGTNSNKNSRSLNLQYSHRYDSHGRDLYNYRTYIPSQRSGLASVARSSSLSPSPPSPRRCSASSSPLPIPSPPSDLTTDPDAWEPYLESIDEEMSLPGLGLDDADNAGDAGVGGAYLSGAGAGAGAQSQTQQYDLQPATEWRFELALGRSITIKVISGQPEFFATELVNGRAYTFTSIKAAVFTWRSCSFTVTSDYGPLSSALTSEYIADETSCNEYINLHFALDKMRITAASASADGPRTLIVGPENSGKTSLAKLIVAYAIRAGRGPVVVNLDPCEGVLSLPGTITSAVFKTLIEVEEGWGNAPMSGPNGEIPVKMPLVYYYGSMNPEDKNGSMFKNQVRQLALSATGKLSSDLDARSSGMVVDTPGSLVSARAAGTGYDILAHVVSEFGIDSIVCLGSERLYSDMAKKFDGRPISRPQASSQWGQEPERIAVVKVTKSGGIAERDTTFMQVMRQMQTRRYFYGDARVGTGITLQPRQQQVDFDTLTVWRRISSSGTATSMAGGGMAIPADDEDSFLPGGLEESEAAAAASAVPLPASQMFERLSAPLPALRNCVLAVMNCPPEPESGTEQEVLRDSSVMGFLYVTDVDEARKRISLLSPVAGRVPPRALIWGEGIDGVLGLV